MLALSDYDYELPRHLIAQHPPVQRTDARLLVVDRASGSLSHHHIRDLPQLLAKDDCLVLNDTRVIPARLVGYREDTRGRWEGLFLEADPQGHWRLLAKTRGKLQSGERIVLVNQQLQDVCRLRLVTKLDDSSWIARPEPPGEAMALLDQVGRVPLPPYIRDGEMDAADRDRYQTVYAANPGAVAAPTAGLHFSEDLFARLYAAGLRAARVTLHVGLDTFKPVTADDLTQHPMHQEWCRIGAEAVRSIEKSQAAGGRIVAVGTTSVRTLESAAQGGKLAPFEGPTSLFIHPPYTFRAVDAILTNFHLPRTTLLVLVRTFGGDELIRRAYDEAIREQYRFYSYGDAMLIL